MRKGGWCRAVSLYGRLDSLRADPGFRDGDRSSGPYILYMEALAGMPSAKRRYYLNRKELQEGQRARYAGSVGHGARPYGTSLLEDGTSVSSHITVRRGDFPEGPEGAYLYRRAYNREWYALKGKRRQGVRYNVSEKVLAARKTRRTRWDTEQGRKAREEFARLRDGKRRKAGDIVQLHRAMDTFLTGPGMLAWTVQGGVRWSSFEMSSRPSSEPVVEGNWNLDQFYRGILYSDGEVSMLVNDVLPLMPEDLQKVLLDIIPRLRETVSDAVVLRGMYDVGEELPDDVRGEINLDRTARSGLMGELSALRKAAKKYIWRHTLLDIPVENQLRPILVVSLLRSGLIAADSSERKGLYLYFKLHRFQMYRRKVKVEASRMEQGRKEQFKRLDRALGTDAGASAGYWDGKVHIAGDGE